MSTGVLSFVKGIDFSRNDFSGDRFPNEMELCTQMTWLKLNRANLERVPDELSRLTNLEHLQMSRNTLTSVHGELSDLPRLRSVIVRHNNIKTAGIPTDVFKMKDLTIIDFSHNQLREVPPNMEYAKLAIVLNLSFNNIESIPNQVFSNLIDLLHLDLSNNRIDMLPPQIRRLTMLQVLKLSNNPLHHFQVKQLPSMTALRVLHLRNTNRTLDNLSELEELKHLSEVDLAENDLPSVPNQLLRLKQLKRLDLSANKIGVIDLCEGEWEQMESLNVSGNELAALPDGLVRLVRLKKLYANNNKLCFEGIPSGIGKLVQLQVLHLSSNQLELIPEGVSRCVNLQRLRLNHNKLITLPDGIHLLPALKELELSDNPDLVMPPKPNEAAKKLAFYNIDFSLDAQRRLASGQSAASSQSSLVSSHKDPVARRKEFLRRRRHQADEAEASKVIEGMTKIAGAAVALAEKEREEKEVQANKSARDWKAGVNSRRKQIDYSEIFDDDGVGEDEGLFVWEIEKFYPMPLDEVLIGQFHDEDSYLILHSWRESTSLKHQIYYWIGEKASLDKGMCAAVHAVGLRDHLNADTRTIREEMNDESDEFLSLFGESITYIEGARTESGFYAVVKQAHVTRLYRASVNGTAVEMEPVPVTAESLDPRFVFLLDCGKEMWIWSGRKARITVANKARLFAVRLNKNDRKGHSEIQECNEMRTPEEFWMALYGAPGRPQEPIVEHVPLDFQPERKRLYHVKMGMGFLELPQLELPQGKCKQDMLKTKDVYILDCTSDIFVWTGKKANRLLKMAGHKMVTELKEMLDRPSYTTVSREVEGEESTMFKCKFVGWDDIVPCDFTRTADSVQRRGADVKVIMQREPIKTDLACLFLDRQPAMCHEDSEQLMTECNEDLELIESFVLEGKKFLKLPEHEFGTFYTMDCYVFLCRYEVLPDYDSQAGSDDEMEEEENDFKCVVYFWQGRDATNMGWLHFTFSLQNTFIKMFKDKLEVVRMHQQQENHKFLSHFNKKFVIRRGRRGLTRNLGGKWPELFQMRANGSIACTRTIQIDARACGLNSAFCHILRAPNRVPTPEEPGVIYVWIGKHSDPHDRQVIQTVAEEMINRDDEKFPVEVVQEGEESDEFWDYLGGKKSYEQDGDFVAYTRLFRCTNEKGYFAVSEKTVDFCQDDLDDDDIMLLDNGTIVFLWIGSRASEVEVKLAYKAAQVYVAHLRMRQQDRPRKLMASLKGRETKRFKKCFHAWGKHKVPAGE